ncbi:hypothetical protein RJ640_004571 [Escallonia rubra]|uniref:Uncharacterized protein n=1 Tax=Escallonia rubra TaxID=112253 RepID=A0AA88RSJ7_9ASTE|nr:hypothetical protein RJ640_004571 [Escallonia rubra]
MTPPFIDILQSIESSVPKEIKFFFKSEPLGEKKPSSKLWSDDTKVSPMVMNPFKVMEKDEQNHTKDEKVQAFLPTLVLLFSLTTRFPESSICAIELCTVVEEFDDQTTLFVMQLSRARLPSVLILRTPFDPLRGTSLFAIHTTIFGNFLYHIPKYRLVELEPLGEKKPNSKNLPEETKVSPSLMDSSDVILSAALQNSKTKNGMKSE